MRRGSLTNIILVLEDEPIVMNFVRRILTEYNVIEATTAEQALQLSIGYGRQLDLLIADVTLPTSSGIHVALLLRSKIPTLPVILASGYPVNDWNDGIPPISNDSVHIWSRSCKNHFLSKHC